MNGTALGSTATVTATARAGAEAERARLDAQRVERPRADMPRAATVSAPAGSASWQSRRGQIEAYFDRTAADTWARLTSGAPVGRIRRTVRAGRDAMRAQLLAWLPMDLAGRRVLDAGCGTGMLAIEAARRGAEVVAVDLAPTLVELGRDRMPTDVREAIEWRAGDFLDPALGTFDHVVAMDSLIHYRLQDVLPALAGLAERTRGSVVFTFAPSNWLLATMHAVGQWFPQGHRSPSIEPVAPEKLRAVLASDPRFAGFAVGRTERVVNGFYTSQAQELVRL
ncbi:MAG: magnesium protoporphyrin IX methyltransferase [Steroidobacteraceae bacterium]|nr:magnesium protoporphyrin IX methyltransferase [Steroidobacteraceae bacterium]